jgi:protein-S-isoprenylcysteine O-methyltransferase Ste14
MQQQLVSPVIMWAIVVLGVVPAIYLLPGDNVYSPSILHRAVFVVALIYWVIMFGSSLYSNREAAESAKEISGLIESGPYSIVRHPIYSSDIICAWGIVNGFPKVNFIVAAAWLTLVMVRWAQLEEEALTERFGKEYLEYRKRTPMLVPNYLKLFRRRRN